MSDLEIKKQIDEIYENAMVEITKLYQEANQIARDEIKKQSVNAVEDLKAQILSKFN